MMCLGLTESHCEGLRGMCIQCTLVESLETHRQDRQPVPHIGSISIRNTSFWKAFGNILEKFQEPTPSSTLKGFSSSFDYLWTCSSKFTPKIPISPILIQEFNFREQNRGYLFLNGLRSKNNIALILHEESVIC